jgi:hypothetical protein
MSTAENDYSVVSFLLAVLLLLHSFPAVDGVLAVASVPAVASVLADPGFLILAGGRSFINIKSRD